MNIDTVKLAVYSPTGTTRRIVTAIAEGVAPRVIEILDGTKPDARRGEVHVHMEALTIIGAPVYAGRTPPHAVDFLNTLTASQAPAVLVAVYGNREFEDVLLELSDLVTAAGFVPVAGAAFIGEHSFSTGARPIAPGRPDADDLAAARAFGVQIREKLSDVENVADLSPLALPGNRPYREVTHFSGITPVTDRALCIDCGACADICPVAAIPAEDFTYTDTDRCTVCCACIKECPTGARAMEHPRVLRIAQWLHDNYSKRKAPEIFL
ncbi:MAG: 4Fe-4S binding protein [Anaerolineae bacterium]|nr:4Fe-4S binding protein [Anaerolineae bacterium]